jgi:hypothetical protein
MTVAVAIPAQASIPHRGADHEEARDRDRAGCFDNGRLRCRCKRPSLAIATALAVLITAASAADAKDRRYRYYLDGHLVKAWTHYPYHFDGQLVKTLTEGDDDLELRYVPGWELNATCHPSKREKGEGDCSGDGCVPGPRSR